MSAKKAKKAAPGKKGGPTKEQMARMYDIATSLAIGQAFQMARKTGRKVTLVIEPKGADE